MSIEEEIRARAHAIYLARQQVGIPGTPEQDWIQAEQLWKQGIRLSQTPSEVLSQVLSLETPKPTQDTGAMTSSDLH